MFNSVLTQFEEDPFFSDPFQVHHEHMRQMMRSFSDPFCHGFMPSMTDGRQRGHRAHRGHRGEGHPNTSTNFRNDRELDFFSNPFSMMDNMRNRMKEMHRNVENMASDSNSHSFSSSSVVTYSKVGDEPAKVFQASSQTRCAPGGIKEMRKSLQDTESGLQKMSIAHHIQDRGHVVERKENKKTGEKVLNQDFQNMDETEAQSFDEEWQRELSRFQVSSPMCHLEAPTHRAVHRAAINAPPQTHKDATAAAGKNTHFNQVNVKGSGVKKQ